jgi:hypothetical protein
VHGLAQPPLDLVDPWKRTEPAPALDSQDPWHDPNAPKLDNRDPWNEALLFEIRDPWRDRSAEVAKAVTTEDPWHATVPTAAFPPTSPSAAPVAPSVTLPRLPAPSRAVPTAAFPPL